MAAFTPNLTYGSAFADGVRVGTVRGGQTNINTGTAQEPVFVPVSYPTFDNGSPGIPLGIDYPYIIMPSASSLTALRAAAAVANPGAVVLTAGAGVTQDTTTFPGYTAYDLGVARTLIFTNAGTANQVIYTISGWDYWGTQVVENATCAAGNNTIVTNKAMRWIHSIIASAASGGTVSIGTSNYFGFPYFVQNASYMFPIWNGVPDYEWDAGAGVMSLLGSFTPGITTFPATATTGDVRGTYLVNPAVAPDGTKVLAVRILMPLVDPIYTRGTNPPTQYAYGVPQFNTGWQ